MLLEFRVKNFKSIRDDTVFSLNASKDKTLADTNLLATGIKSIPKVVASAAIFGSNASGKSNFINAIAYFKEVVRVSASIPVDTGFSVKSFALDKTTQNAPIEFEITFLKQGVRYQYGFVMTTSRIIEEWLLVYKTAKPQLWFERKFDKATEMDIYQFGSSFKGQKDIWKKSTRANSLFLSMAVQLNSEQLIPIYKWIVHDIVLFGAQGLPINDFSTQLLQTAEGKKAITDFLKSADISIDDIDVSTKKNIAQHFSFDALTGKSDLSTQEEDIQIPIFKHSTVQGKATFEIQEESLGTQRLFALAGPILDILKQGRVLVFDELDSSFHTLLAKRLVELFQTPKLNTNNAQLIFTTHDTTLLHKDLLRRDQVWFVDKGIDQASIIYPLTDFSPRKKESIENGYLMGRYGGVPFLQDIEVEGLQ